MKPLQSALGVRQVKPNMAVACGRPAAHAAPCACPRFAPWRLAVLLLFSSLRRCGAPAAGDTVASDADVPPLIGPREHAWHVRRSEPLDTAWADTLAVVMLHTQPWAHSYPILERCLRLVDTHLAPSTPSAVYVFHRLKPPPELLSAAGALLNVTRVRFLELSNADWRLPNGPWTEPSRWTLHNSEDYRIMGHWRLVFPFEFARHVGHTHLLFLDDDSRVLAPPLGGSVNMLASLRDAGIDIAYRRLVKDPMVGRGLAELARYFLVSNRLQPVGALFADCKPPSIEGLVSPLANGNGWRTTVVNGNFVFLSLDWWFTPDVQQFLALVLATGDHIRHRWNEQQVIGMLRLLFIPPERERALVFAYEHDHKHNVRG
jgi:hypothetical protein